MSLEINSYRASDLFRSPSMYQPLIYINENTTVVQCLNLLASKNILSVPVYDQSKKNWIGIIDVYQIMTYIAFSGSKADDTITLESVLDKVKLNVPVVEILGITGKRENDVIKSLWELPVHAPLLKVMEYLGKGIYRILVTDSEIPLSRLITQTDMIRFIHKHWDQFGDFKNTQNISFIKPVYTIPHKQLAIYGFQLMRKKEVNAIAVINESGSIVTTLSDSDLRAFTQDQFEYLFVSTTEFLSRAHGGEIRKPVVCSDTDNLKRVVDLIVREKIHRVWIVDGEMKPIGVVSMTDICLHFYSNLLNP